MGLIISLKDPIYRESLPIKACRSSSSYISSGGTMMKELLIDVSSYFFGHRHH